MLNLINVNKHYGKKHALKDFSFEFGSGIYSLLGPNGAGKSTLMNIITDNIKADKDSKIMYDNTATVSLGAEFRAKIGYMPQHQNLYDSFTAMRFMMYMSALKGLPKKDAEKEILELLEKVELIDVKDKKIGGFSGGMKQRLLLSQALLGNPQIIILDEPSAGLDPKQRATVRNILIHLAKEEEKTIIISTHIIPDIENISTKVLFLKGGVLINSGKPQKLINESEGEFENLEEIYLSYFGEEGEV